MAEAFATLLRQHRMRRRLTQEALADRAGISARSISDMERGRGRAPRPHTTRKLAEALGLTGQENDEFIQSAERLRWQSRADQVDEENDRPAAAPVLDAAPRTPQRREVTQFSLPAEMAAFTGRGAELERIVSPATEASRGGAVVAIHAIDGMPGMGKTALAVHAAHLVAGHYPDQQLFVDLHGHTPGHSPTPPDEALASLLRADGVEPAQLPDDPDALAALWRERMASRRAVLVLDNAASADQVAPLLPGGDTVLVLVTSRRQLTGLRGATHLKLKTLPPDDAIAMFVRLAPRAEAESALVSELVRLCDYLPLAISIVASRFAARATTTMTDLVSEIRTNRQRLLTLQEKDVTVRSAFDLSYRFLTEDRQRFFRLLGLSCGVDFDAYSAAAITGSTVDQAEHHLEDLVKDHLLEGTAQRRYRMHDLVRTYARALTAAADSVEERDQALDRLLDYYQHAARHADAIIAVDPPNAPANQASPAALPELNDWGQAAQWLRTERLNVLSCLRHANTYHQWQRTIAFTAGLSTLLRTDGPWTLAAQLHQHAARIARERGDRLGEANALNNLATMRRMAGDNAGAEDMVRQALELYREQDCRLGQATTLNILGRMRMQRGHYQDVEELLQQALDFFRRLGHRHGEAATLNTLGRLRMQTGDYPGAEAALRPALDLYRAIGHLHGHGATLNNLGSVALLTGEYHDAADLLRQALEFNRVLGTQHGQANTLTNLGWVHLLTGDYAEAEELLKSALDLYRALGTRLGQANSINDLGWVRLLSKDYFGADALLCQALDMFQELGNRHGQAFARMRLGVMRCQTGDHRDAEILLQQSLTEFRAVGALDDEAEALNHLGNLRRSMGDPHHAITLHQQALALSQGIHHRLEQARAMEGMGHAFATGDDLATATAHLRQALQLYQQLAVPEVSRVAAAITRLDALVDS